MKARDGFCYVVDTVGYLNEAMSSLASLRIRMGNIPVTIVAPRELFRLEAPVTDWIDLPKHRSGPIVKTASRLAPYERVIFVDTDTYVASDLTGLFDVLDAFDIAVAHDVTRGNSYETPIIPRSFCEYNTGVIAFRNNQRVKKFFERWEEQYDLIFSQHGETNDQPAFRAALWMTPRLRHATLGSEDNFIGCVPGGVEGAVRLLHDRSDNLSRLASTLNHEVAPRAFAPGWGTIFGFRGRRDWIRQYLRLSRNFFRVLGNPTSIRQNEGPVKWWEEAD
jgi:hypothetical protein